jgi:hypothetical protein
LEKVKINKNKLGEVFEPKKIQKYNKDIHILKEKDDFLDLYN